MKKGFTIIELMVVISIIGLLTAISLPRFTGITKDSEIAQIQSNRRNLQTSLDMAIVREDIKTKDLSGYYSVGQLADMGIEGGSVKGIDIFVENYISGNVPALPKTDRNQVLITDEISEEYIKDNMEKFVQGNFGWVFTHEGYVYPLLEKETYGLSYEEF